MQLELANVMKAKLRAFLTAGQSEKAAESNAQKMEVLREVLLILSVLQ